MLAAYNFLASDAVDQIIYNCAVDRAYILIDIISENVANNVGIPITIRLVKPDNTEVTYFNGIVAYLTIKLVLTNGWKIRFIKPGGTETGVNVFVQGREFT